MLFKEYKIEKFINELASDAPSPGGGSTAAFVGALAGSLNNMVYSLTINKKSFEILEEEKKNDMINFEKECKKFIENCIAFMDEDRLCFNNLMKCYRLPKSTDEEKNYRETELKSKTYEAMIAPLKVCRECIKFYENIEFAIKYGNKMLVSDAGVSASLLHSAIESSIINVKVNLNSLKNENYFNEIKLELEEILNKSRKYKNEMLEEVNNKIFC